MQKKRRRAFWKLYSLVKQVVGWTDSKMKKWMAVKNRLNNIQHLKEQTLTLPSASQHAFESENVMVGHENTFEIMQDRLARGGMELEVVTIVDMGGIGKTTLATKIYNDPFTISRFDIRSKVTVSHKYCVRSVVMGLLSYISAKTNDYLEHQ
ncbi:putative late blight resistance protein homolog R1B-23 [Capsicum annuum]|uniref:putative late blight resistance protein homolog R1B-23 n=1 Tax=Capsicum annuum TaxID=4072 RepID=UPI001FB06193|nr:putative late blight resistance protein homolog R1B-23 [Capsicum annuum]